MVIDDLPQIDVEIEFTDDEDQYFVDEVNQRRWHYDVVYGFDWKVKKAYNKCVERLSKKGSAIVLFDGSDAIWLTTEESAEPLF